MFGNSFFLHLIELKLAALICDTNYYSHTKIYLPILERKSILILCNFFVFLSDFTFITEMLLGWFSAGKKFKGGGGGQQTIDHCFSRLLFLLFVLLFFFLKF